MAANQSMYIHGNTVRQPEVMPQRPQKQPSQPKKVSRQAKQNRKRALHMSAGYVAFLSVAAITSLVICVNYLQLSASITSRSENITALQKQLETTKEANNTAHAAAVGSITLDQVKEKAINEMGMVSAQAGQFIEYQSPSSNLVKQYEDIPESGVISGSRKVAE